jgi:hypothetical protein
MIKPQDISIDTYKKLHGKLYEARLDVRSNLFRDKYCHNNFPDSVIYKELRGRIYDNIYGDIRERALAALESARTVAGIKAPGYEGELDIEQDETYRLIQELINCIPERNSFSDYEAGKYIDSNAAKS